MSLQCVPDMRTRGIHDVGCGDPLPVDADCGGIDAGHVENVLKQARESIQFSGRRARLLGTFILRQVAAQVLDRRLDSSQWRPQVMTE